MVCSVKVPEPSPTSTSTRTPKTTTTGKTTTSGTTTPSTTTPSRKTSAARSRCALREARVLTIWVDVEAGDGLRDDLGLDRLGLRETLQHRDDDRRRVDLEVAP